MSRFKIWSRTSEYLSLTEIEPPALADLHAYWSQVGGGDVPRQTDLNPRAMGEALHHVALVEIERRPAGARYLLVGEALKRLLGADPTGKRIDEVYSRAVAREVYEAFSKAVRSREAAFYRRDFQILGKTFGYFRLILPLSGRDGAVERLLIAIYPTDPSLKRARQWREAVEDLERRRRAEASMETAWGRSLGYVVEPMGERDDD